MFSKKGRKGIPEHFFFPREVFTDSKILRPEGQSKDTFLFMYYLFSSSTSDPSIHTSHSKEIHCLDWAADGCWCAPCGPALLVIYSMLRPCKISVSWKPPLKVAKSKGSRGRTSRTIDFQPYVLLFQGTTLCNSQNAIVYSSFFSSIHKSHLIC